MGDLGLYLMIKYILFFFCPALGEEKKIPTEHRSDRLRKENKAGALNSSVNSVPAMERVWEWELGLMLQENGKTIPNNAIPFNSYCKGHFPLLPSSCQLSALEQL